MQLTALTNAELLRHAHNAFDSLTSTELEGELLKRFAALIDEADEFADVRDLMDDHDLGSENIVGLFKLLEEFDAIDQAVLRQKLERANKFYEIAQEAGDLFFRLNDLTNATL